MTDQPKGTPDPIEPEPTWRGWMSRTDQQGAPKIARGQGALERKWWPWARQGLVLLVAGWFWPHAFQAFFEGFNKEYVLRGRELLAWQAGFLVVYAILVGLILMRVGRRHWREPECCCQRKRSREEWGEHLEKEQKRDSIDNFGFDVFKNPFGH